jgi:diacylglycerol kinase family enzyme
VTASFDRIVVIFNPYSTGDGPQLAEQLHADLTRRLPEVPVRLRPTEHAGHARDLAREAAQTGHPHRSRRPGHPRLITSSPKRATDPL